MLGVDKSPPLGDALLLGISVDPLKISPQKEASRRFDNHGYQTMLGVRIWGV